MLRRRASRELPIQSAREHRRRPAKGGDERHEPSRNHTLVLPEGAVDGTRMTRTERRGDDGRGMMERVRSSGTAPRDRQAANHCARGQAAAIRRNATFTSSRAPEPAVHQVPQDVPNGRRISACEAREAEAYENVHRVGGGKSSEASSAGAPRSNARKQLSDLHGCLRGSTRRVKVALQCAA